MQNFFLNIVTTVIGDLMSSAGKCVSAALLQAASNCISAVSCDADCSHTNWISPSIPTDPGAVIQCIGAGILGNLGLLSGCAAQVGMSPDELAKLMLGKLNSAALATQLAGYLTGLGVCLHTCQSSFEGQVAACEPLVPERGCAPSMCTCFGHAGCQTMTDCLAIQQYEKHCTSDITGISRCSDIDSNTGTGIDVRDGSRISCKSYSIIRPAAGKKRCTDIGPAGTETFRPSL